MLFSILGGLDILTMPLEHGSRVNCVNALKSNLFSVFSFVMKCAGSSKKFPARSLQLPFLGLIYHNPGQKSLGHRNFLTCFRCLDKTDLI